MPLRLNRGTIPPGGWHFPRTENEPLKAHSYDSLLDAILKDRISNNREIGNIVQEVNDYYCNKWPHFCGKISVTTKRKSIQAEKKNTLRDRVAAWLANRGQRRFDLETQDIAEERAKICESCPKNTILSDNLCAPCKASRKRQSAIIVQNKKVQESLGACSVIGQWNPTAVFLPKEGLARAKEFLQDLPNQCWLKSLYE